MHRNFHFQVSFFPSEHLRASFLPFIILFSDTFKSQLVIFLEFVHLAHKINAFLQKAPYLLLHKEILIILHY